MNEGFPKHYDILPAPVERVIEVAQRLGRFLFTTPEVHPYMSEHYRGAAEMLDQQLYEPSDGEAIPAPHTVLQYIEEARQARQ